MLVLVVCSCPSSVHVVATFPGTVLFPLLCSVLQFFCLIHWFFSLSSFVIPSKCLKNFICAASKRCSSLFFSTQTSLPKITVYMVSKVNLVSIPWVYTSRKLLCSQKDPRDALLRWAVMLRTSLTCVRSETVFYNAVFYLVQWPFPDGGGGHRNVLEHSLIV